MGTTEYTKWKKGSDLLLCISWFIWFLLSGVGIALGSPSSALREYNNGKYDQALKDYEQLLQRKEDPRLHFNAGASAYRNGRLDEAAKQFNEAINSPDLKLQQRAYFNHGNTLYYLGAGLPDASKRNEVWKKSFEDFQSTLKLDPQDADAKFNLEYVKKKLEELKQQQQQQNQNKSDQQQNQDQQQQQQQQNNQSKQDQSQQKQQAQQNQSGQKQDSSQQNQQAQQQKQEEQKQTAEQSQQQQAQQQQNQQQAASQSGKPEEKSDEKKQQQSGLTYAEGQMTPDQARQLLDSQKGEEMVLPVKPEGKPVDQNKPFKDW